MTKAETAEKALLAMVDELGELEQEVQPYKAKLARVDALRRAIRAPYAGADANTRFEVRGRKYMALVGLAGNESSVDQELLQKLVGTTKFLTVSTVSIRALSDAFGSEVFGAVVSTTQTGTRDLQVVPLATGKRKAS